MAQSETGKRDSGAATEASRQDTDRRDAIALLTADHREVEALFKRYESAGDENERAAIAEQVCLALRVHAQIEEEIFYPAAKRRIEDGDLVDEALVEHGSAKQLIAEIEDAEVGDPMVQARMQVLSEQIAHHVKEEESELFPEVREADLDLQSLGARLAQRKSELMAEVAGEDEAAGESRAFADDSDD